MVIRKYIDPNSKCPLTVNNLGDLVNAGNRVHVVYRTHDGIYDFTGNSDERDFYNDVYKISPGEVDVKESIQLWGDPRYPEHRILLESLGDLRDKTMLLLGNGNSSKELYFLDRGAKVVYTDLSIHAAQRMKDGVLRSVLKRYVPNRLEFHAVDALRLPFPDNSFDIIYGYAFVHHLDRMDLLFKEVYRCLKPGGICRFLDGAHSPIWQLLKATVLRPLQWYTHKRVGLSPEDMRATKRGGYRKEELRRLMDDCGFESMLFQRVSFFQALFRRGVGKLLGYNHAWIQKDSSWITSMNRLDEFCMRRSRLIRANLLKLVWGFQK